MNSSTTASTCTTHNAPTISELEKIITEFGHLDFPLVNAIARLMRKHGFDPVRDVAVLPSRYRDKFVTPDRYRWVKFSPVVTESIVMVRNTDALRFSGFGASPE